MKEVFEVSDEVFGQLVAVDVIVANIWMAGLLWAAGRSKEIDAKTGADASAIEHVREKVQEYRASISKIPTLTDTMTVLAVGFAVTAIAHACADFLAPFLMEKTPQLQRFSLTSHFFWLIVIATTMGLILSSRSEVRRLEGVGASRLGSAFLYVLVATIGMKMDLKSILDRPGLFAVGLVWISIHAILLIGMARIIKAPIFFLAVGSQANVGAGGSIARGARLCGGDLRGLVLRNPHATRGQRLARTEPVPGGSFARGQLTNEGGVRGGRFPHPAGFRRDQAGPVDQDAGAFLEGRRPARCIHPDDRLAILDVVETVGTEHVARRSQPECQIESGEDRPHLGADPIHHRLRDTHTLHSDFLRRREREGTGEDRVEFGQ
jgi:hypothetical protein